MCPRMKLVVAYLGASFCGWQRQLDQPTVQGELEEALRRSTGFEAAVVGAGRTDSGVHAAGQVAHVDLPVFIPPAGLQRGLNGVLHEAIRVRRVVAVRDAFHARRSARGKHYAYRAVWRESTLPWVGLRAARTRPPEDWQALQTAVAMLPGDRDMGSFTVVDPEQGSHAKILHRVDLARHDGGLTFHFVGDGFLRYQVRRMVGAVLEVGWGRRTVDSLRLLLDEPRPGSGIWTAPARGLTLERVLYRRFKAVRRSSVAAVAAEEGVHRGTSGHVLVDSESQG